MSFVWLVIQQLGRVAPFLLFGLLIEALSAARHTPRRNQAFNIVYTVGFWTIEIGIAIGFANALVRGVSQLPGAGLLPVPAPQTAPALAILSVVWMIGEDFFYYWMHRAQHQIAWLWAEHEVHHSDEAINVTTTWRHHWLERVLTLIAIDVPMVYLFAPPIAVLAVNRVLGDLVAHFIHLNTTLSFGRWSWTFANPQHHRIHHSRERSHVDTNFAARWPLWDVLFGTYYPPQPGEFPATGLHSGQRIETISEAVIWPFQRWAQMVRGQSHSSVTGAVTVPVEQDCPRDA